MKVLCDHHHGDLLYSLYLLFEKRLNWELYIPFGMDWYNNDYWSFGAGEPTARAYLEGGIFGGNPQADSDGIAVGKFSHHGDATVHKGITLDAFKADKFDIILSSMPQHFPRFERLRREYQPQAKHIFQVGNSWDMPEEVKNLLNSTLRDHPNVPNQIRYHQEFNLDIFKYSPISNYNVITNLKHCLLPPFSDLVLQYEKQLSDYRFDLYGQSNRLGSTMEVPRVIKNTTFIWHIKPEDDGYGYILHHSYAMGRPVLTYLSHYAINRHAKLLMEDCVTCIDLERRSIFDNERIIRLYSDPENALKLSETCYNRFKEVVNFDAEFEKIKIFLERLV